VALAAEPRPQVVVVVVVAQAPQPRSLAQARVRSPLVPALVAVVLAVMVPAARRQLAPVWELPSPEPWLEEAGPAVATPMAATAAARAAAAVVA